MLTRLFWSLGNGIDCEKASIQAGGAQCLRIETVKERSKGRFSKRLASWHYVSLHEAAL